MRWAAAVVLVTASHAVAAPLVAPPFRLPHTFEPARYRVRIALGDKRFTGHVEIDGELNDAVSLIWLHGEDLVVAKARAVGSAGTIELAASPSPDGQMLGFEAAKELPTGKWTLAIDYEGPIRELQPRVRDPRTGQDGDAWATGVFRRGKYVYTQGEAIYARRIVPCIDEPDRKVPWQLTLDVASDALAASNTPIVRETPLDATHKRVEFAETRPLPSYLLAFAVGPFDVVDAGHAKDGTPIRILVAKGHGGNTWWAAADLPRMVDFLGDYFAMRYPYGKLDVVSVPALGFGAMENPGLITINTRALEQRRDHIGLAHELAHQWFGDLVTMKWWDEIWLNESFAEWMADKIETHLAAERDDIAALHARGVSSLSLPLRAPAAKLRELEGGAFAPRESIERGAERLAMLEAHVGVERFRDAMRAYVGAHADRNVTAADLEAALQHVSAEPLALEMVVTSGTPTVGSDVVCDARGARLVVGKLLSATKVCVAYDRDGKRATKCELVHDDIAEIALPAKKCPAWVLPEAGANGLYAVYWKQPSFDALLAHGWPLLTRDERVLVFDQVREPERKLAVFLKLAPGEMSVHDRARYLADLAKYVPDDLRARFDANVEAELGARARAVHFTLTPLGTRAWWDDTAIVDLVALTRDAEMTREAKALAAHYQDVSDDYVDDVLALAVPGDPALADRVYRDVLGDNVESFRNLSIITTLARFPDVRRKIVESRGFDQVQWGVLRGLLDAECTPALLEEAKRLGKREHPWVPDTIQDCLRDKQLLDPLLRAWLAPPKQP